MSRKSTAILSAGFLLLAAVAAGRRCPTGDPELSETQGSAHQPVPGGYQPVPGGSAISREAARSRHERREREATGSHSELEADFDRILPAQFPQQFSSICDVTLETGESLVLGGFRKADGNHEFTKITVTPKIGEGAGGNYSIKSTTLVLTPEKSSELGYDTLISPAKTRIQKGLIVDSNAHTGAGDYVQAMLAPLVVCTANTPATISVGNSESAHVISTLISPVEDAGSFRLRVRIESPEGSR